MSFVIQSLKKQTSPYPHTKFAKLPPHTIKCETDFVLKKNKQGGDQIDVNNCSVQQTKTVSQSNKTE